MKTAKSYHCPWCGERKHLDDMRQSPRSNGRPGRASAYCKTCREGNPGMYFCRYHNEAHPLAEFSIRPGAELPGRDCEKGRRAAEQVRAGRVRECLECEETKPLAEMGGSSTTKGSSPVCMDCRAQRAGESFCVECAKWLPDTHFTHSANGVRKGAKCRPCRNAVNHGTTSKEILAKQGSDKIECAACGYEGPNMRIDHDHSCCEGQWGCSNCVRGYLCQRCNVAEGNITSRAQLEGLIAYMERHGVID